MFEKNFNVQFSYDYKKINILWFIFFYIFFFILDTSEIKVIVKGFCLFISVIFIDAQNMVFWNTFVIHFFIIWNEAALPPSKKKYNFVSNFHRLCLGGVWSMQQTRNISIPWVILIRQHSQIPTTTFKCKLFRQQRQWQQV